MAKKQIDRFAEAASGYRGRGRPPKEQEPLRRVERTLSGKKR